MKKTAALLDDKGKADNFLGGLQQTEEAKLKKKAELEQGLLLLEQICDAVEQGVLPENIPTYINSIRGGHRICKYNNDRTTQNPFCFLTMPVFK